MIRDPIDIKNSNIWEKNKNNTSEANLNQSNQIIIVMGDRRAGKTSFIKILKSDFDLQTKPTYLVDYSCIKKANQNTIESIQIGSPELQGVLQYYVNFNNCKNITLVTCVDLTNPNNLVQRMSEQIEKVRSLCKKIVQKNSLNQIKEYSQQRNKCYTFIQKNQDIQQIKRMPFRSMIIGCKYDLFQKMNVQHKKWISRTLRYIAHINESSLLSCSTKITQIGVQVRNIIANQLSIARNSRLTNQKDYNKPFFILSGQDKISEMSLPAFNNSGAFNQLKILQQQMASIFLNNPSQQTKSKNKSQGSRFIGIDTLINRHKKQIQKSIKQLMRKEQDPLKDTFMKTDNLMPSVLENKPKIERLQKVSTKLQVKEQKSMHKQYKQYKQQKQSYLDVEDQEAQNYSQEDE